MVDSHMKLNHGIPNSGSGSKVTMPKVSLKVMTLACGLTSTSSRIFMFIFICFIYQGKQSYEHHMEKKKGIKYFCPVCNAGPYFHSSHLDTHKKVHNTVL